MRCALLTAVVATVLAMPLTAAADDVGVGALLTLDGSPSHGGGIGTTLHLDAHLGGTAVRASVIAATFMSMIDPRDHDVVNVAGGTLLSPTVGVRQRLYMDFAIQPWVAAALGYGWFWFDQEDLDKGHLGIDSSRAAWYLEAGADLVPTGSSSGLGMTLSLRALSSPVGMLWFVSFAGFWDER